MSRWPLEWLHRRARRRVFVGLDAHGMAWQFNGAPPSSVATTTEASALAQKLLPRTRVDVAVANDVAVHWLQTPPDGVRSLAELRQIAAARCAHLFGGLPERWWVAGDWNANRPFVCAGLPMDRVDPLQRALTQAGAAVHWHTVWGLLCSTQARSMPAEGWSAVRSGGRVVAWHCRRGRVTSLHAVNVGEQASDAQRDEAVAQLLRIEALRDPALASGPVHWAQLPASVQAQVSDGASITVALLPWLSGAVP